MRAASNAPRARRPALAPRPRHLFPSLALARILSAPFRARAGGWEHYALHRPEPHILLFRRALGTDPTTGKVNPALREQAVQEYRREFGLDHTGAVPGGK